MTAYVIDVRDAPYGAVPDAVKLTLASCNGTGASCAGANFTVADVGKAVKIINGYTNDGIFRGTISSVTNATAIVLSGSVASTISGTAVIYYGTNNSTALQAAFDAAEAVPLTDDARVKVIAPTLPTGGGYLFSTALTSNNIDIDADAPFYANVGLGNTDTTIPWTLGNSDITNLYIDVTGSNGLDWGQSGFHKIAVKNRLEIDNVSFNGQVGLTTHGFGFKITGAIIVNKGSGSYVFSDCQDINGESGFLYANGSGYGPIMNGVENTQLNIVCDTVGNASFLLDAAHGVKLNVQNFVNGSNTSATGKIGSVSTTTNHAIEIDILAQTSGGPAVYVDYCDGGVKINITATNKRMNSNVHNDLTYAVQYGSHNSGTLDIDVVRDADIPLYTGTQYGNLTDNCGGSTKVYGLTGTLSQLDFSSGLTTVADGLTRYLGQGCVSATESDVQFSVTFPFTIVGLYANTVTSPTGTSFYTVRKNGADTAVTAYIGGVVNANPKTSDTAHSVSFVAGDLISLKLVTNGGVPTRNHRCSIVASM